jgi:hypothetical protein
MACVDIFDGLGQAVLLEIVQKLDGSSSGA